MEEDKKAPQFVQELKKPSLADIHGFPNSLTNAECILQLSKKLSVLPNFGGEKSVQPNEASVKRTSEYYNELSDILSEERVCRIGSLSQGRWEPTKKLIVVNRAVGSLWQKFGTNIGGVLYALPEEGLFLIEQGVFELYLNELPLSVEESWVLLLRNLPSLEYYTVFAFLCRLGFAVFSNRKQEYFTGSGFTASGDATVNQSAKKHLDITQRTSQEELEEELFSKAPPKFPSISFQMNDSQPSQLLEEVESFVKEDIHSWNQTTPTEAVSKGTPGNSFGLPTVKGDKDNIPLVLPQDAVSVDAVMRKLQIIPRRPFCSRSLNLTSGPAGIDGPWSLNKEVHSAVCIQNVTSSDIKDGRNVEERKGFRAEYIVERISAAEKMETSNITQDEYDIVGQPLETSARVPVLVAATESQSRKLDLVGSAIPDSVEQGITTPPLALGNDKTLSTPTLPSLELSKEDSLCSDFEMDLAQNRMQIAGKSDSPEFVSDTVAVGDMPRQVLCSTSLLERTKIPSRAVPFFDVYYKTTAFKKSSPGPPHCRIFPCNYSELPLNLEYLDSIFDCCKNIPVRFGLCEQSSVTFYSIIRTNVSVILNNDKPD